MMYEDEEERELSDLLNKNYAFLVNHIRVTDLLPFLIAREAITETDKEEINSKPTSVDRRGKPKQPNAACNACTCT